MSEELTYELGLQEGLEMINMWEDGKFETFPDVIKNYMTLKELNALSEWGRGILDAWERHNDSH